MPSGQQPPCAIFDGRNKNYLLDSLDHGVYCVPDKLRTAPEFGDKAGFSADLKEPGRERMIAASALSEMSARVRPFGWRLPRGLCVCLAAQGLFSGPTCPACGAAHLSPQVLHSFRYRSCQNL
jgi:hypothetical protein